MDYIYFAAIISILFVIFKFLETRIIVKEKINLKQLLIDGILVYLSVIIGYIVNEQFMEQTKNLAQAPVFIDSQKF